MEREDTVQRFRGRLIEVIERAGVSRQAFAAQAGIDRSTLSQVLAPRSSRLPRLETIVAIAQSQGVSIDWLVGLSEEGGLTTRVVQQSLEVRAGGQSPSDELLSQWHVEALGTKIRHVPKTIPDLLKTPAVIDYEYRQTATLTPEQVRSSARQDLDYQRRPETDTEVCCSMQALQAFAWGEGVWSGLRSTSRRSQLRKLADITRELYPRYRWFLYDGRERYSVPLTVFGLKRAAIYFGQMYWVFNSTEHIRIAADHFDDLIRSAVVQPTGIWDVATKLADGV